MDINSKVCYRGLGPSGGRTCACDPVTSSGNSLQKSQMYFILSDLYRSFTKIALSTLCAERRPTRKTFKTISYVKQAAKWGIKKCLDTKGMLPRDKKQTMVLDGFVWSPFFVCFVFLDDCSACSWQVIQATKMVSARTPRPVFFHFASWLLPFCSF